MSNYTLGMHTVSISHGLNGFVLRQTLSGNSMGYVSKFCLFDAFASLSPHFNKCHF